MHNKLHFIVFGDVVTCSCTNRTVSIITNPFALQAGIKQYFILQDNLKYAMLVKESNLGDTRRITAMWHGHHGVSNYWRLDYSFSNLFMLMPRAYSKLPIVFNLWGDLPVARAFRSQRTTSVRDETQLIIGFSDEGPVMRRVFKYHDVFMTRVIRRVSGKSEIIHYSISPPAAHLAVLGDL